MLRCDAFRGLKVCHWIHGRKIVDSFMCVQRERPHSIGPHKNLKTPNGRSGKKMWFHTLQQFFCTPYFSCIIRFCIFLYFYTFQVSQNVCEKNGGGTTVVCIVWPFYTSETAYFMQCFQCTIYLYPSSIHSRKVFVFYLFSFIFSFFILCFGYRRFLYLKAF